MEINRTLKTIWLGMAILMVATTLVGGLVIFFISGDLTSYLLGAALGAAGAFLSVFYMSYSVNQSIDKMPKRAERYALRHYFFRSAGMIAILLVAIQIEKINVVAVVLMLMTVKPAAYLSPTIESRLYKSGRQ